jgi:hypothetical protein
MGDVILESLPGQLLAEVLMVASQCSGLWLIIIKRPIKLVRGLKWVGLNFFRENCR